MAKVLSLSAPHEFVYFACEFRPEKDWISTIGSGFWVLSRALRHELINKGFVQNRKDDSVRGSYVEANFMLCSKRVKNSTMLQYEDDKFHAEVLPCQNKYCFDCSDARPRRDMREIANFLIAIVDKFKCKTAYHIIFTLPKKLQKNILYDSQLEKKLRMSMRRITKKLVLLSNNIDKKNIPLYESRHIVGKESLMRGRIHYHYVALSGICIDSTNKNEIITKTLTGFIPKKMLLRVNEQWQKALEKTCKNQIESFSRARATFINLEGNINKKKDQLLRLLCYVSKGFGKQFISAPLFYHPTKKQVLILERKSNQKQYVVYTLEDYIKQWVHVRNMRQVSSVGILYGKKRFAKLLGIQCIEEPIPKVIDIDQVEVERSHSRNAKNELQTHTKVSIKDSTGETVPLDPSTYHLGKRGKNKRWTPSSVV